MDWILAHWAEIGVGYLLFAKILLAVRDAIDTTPGEDTNNFERAVTFVNNLAGYLIAGKRPK